MESRLVMTDFTNIGGGRQRRSLVITEHAHCGSLAGSNLTEGCRPNTGRSAYVLEYELYVCSKPACRLGVVTPTTILGGSPGAVFGAGVGTVMHQGRIACSLRLIGIQAISVHDNA